MISKRDLYIRLGKLKSTESLLEEIERYIIDAAEKGENNITYVFSDKYDKEAKDALYKELIEKGYYVPSGIYSNAYDKIEIHW